MRGAAELASLIIQARRLRRRPSTADAPRETDETGRRRRPPKSCMPRGPQLRNASGSILVSRRGGARSVLLARLGPRPAQGAQPPARVGCANSVGSRNSGDFAGRSDLRTPQAWSRRFISSLASRSTVSLRVRSTTRRWVRRLREPTTSQRWTEQARRSDDTHARRLRVRRGQELQATALAQAPSSTSRPVAVTAAGRGCASDLARTVERRTASISNER
jgi:hypothetical protein